MEEHHTCSRRGPTVVIQEAQMSKSAFNQTLVEHQYKELTLCMTYCYDAKMDQNRQNPNRRKNLPES
jgi:hypothetical protein